MASANDQLIDTFKEIVWDPLIQVGLNLLYAKIPFLAWGPFRWLTNYIVEHYSDILYDSVSTMINLQAIAFKNKEAEKLYDIDSIDLYLIADEHGTDSKIFKDKRAESRKSMQNVVQFGVVRAS